MKKIICSIAIAAVLAAMMPLGQLEAYGGSIYCTEAERIEQNKKMYKEAESISASEAKKYLEPSLSDMYITKRKGMSIKEQKEVREFAEKILEDAGNPDADIEKIKAFHDWIKYNFYYYRNVETLDITKKYGNLISTKGCVDSPAALLMMYKNREKDNLKGIIARCTGYSGLFIAFCRAEGIPARAVRGYYNEKMRRNQCKGEIWAPEKDEADHTWAMAYVDNRWIQVDCNADCYQQYKSGSTYWKISGGSFPTGQRYNYFDPTAERLAQSHIIFEFMPDPKVSVAYISSLSKASKGIKISWKASYGATSYKVYRATSKNGRYTAVKTTKNLSFTDKASLKKGKKYYYKLRAYNGAFYSKYSPVKYIKY